MRRVAAFRLTLVCAALMLESPVRAAEPTTPDISAAEFDALVKKGDQARIAGKWSEALKAYSAALDIRDDPLISGRLGLVIIEYGEYEAAVGKLFQAVERGAGANDAERTSFFQAFLIAKKETCRLDFIVVQNGVKIELDGEPRFGNRREFWSFVKAGKHKLKATLEGFEDDTIEFDAPKGGQLNFTISLRPVKPAEEPAKEPEREPKKSESAWNVPEDKPPADRIEDKPPQLANSKKKNPSFVVGTGIGVVFGATPTAAMGPNIFAAWRSRSWWEIGLDARIAWTLLTDKRFPETQFVTWSASATPCGRLRDRWFGCLQLGVDGMSGGSRLKVAVLPAFGIRAGREFALLERLRFQVLADVVAHTGEFAFVAEDAAWRGFFLTGSVGGRLVYKF